MCIPNQRDAAAAIEGYSGMRGAIRSSSGISFADALPKPVPVAGQVLLRVVAAGINPADYKIPKFIGGKVVGLEAAGVIEAVGPEVTSFGIGDEVFGFTVMGNGGLAEFALADAKKICKKPAALPWASAGSMPTTFLTGCASAALDPPISRLNHQCSPPCLLTLRSLDRISPPQTRASSR